jgi:hypothetical protein
MNFFNGEGPMPPKWAGDILKKAESEIKGRGGEARKEIVLLTMMLEDLLSK